MVDHWEAAERLAAAAMRSWGYSDARVTNRGADGGIDVRSRRAVAQVKYVTAKTGRPDIQKLVGASRHDVQRFFFSHSGYSKTAVTYAISAGVALFTYDALGRVQPFNAHARVVLEQAGAQPQPAVGVVPPQPAAVTHPRQSPRPVAPYPPPRRAPVHGTQHPHPRAVAGPITTLPVRPRRAVQPIGPTTTLPRQPRLGPSRARVVATWLARRWAWLLLAWVWLVVAAGVNRLVQVGPDKLTQLTVWSVAAVVGTVLLTVQALRRRR